MRMLWAPSPICLVLAMAGLAKAQVPDVVHYQARLVDPDTRLPINEPTRVHFAIFTDSTGGTAIWEEDQTVTPSNGVFSVLLGSVTQAPTLASVFTGADRWLGLTIGPAGSAPTDVLAPRTRFGAVPYAFKVGSNVVSSVDGVSNDGGDIDLVAGPGMAITADAAANRITFTNSAPGGVQLIASATGPLVSDSLTTNASTVISLNFVAPAAGKILVTASGIVDVVELDPSKHTQCWLVLTTNPNDNVTLSGNTGDGILAPRAPRGLGVQPPDPDFPDRLAWPFSTARSIDVAAGSGTVFLRARLDARPPLGSNPVKVLVTSLNILFFPD
jgi:hypothetical protein